MEHNAYLHSYIENWSSTCWELKLLQVRISGWTLGERDQRIRHNIFLGNRSDFPNTSTYLFPPSSWRRTRKERRQIPTGSQVQSRRRPIEEFVPAEGGACCNWRLSQSLALPLDTEAPDWGGSLLYTELTLTFLLWKRFDFYLCPCPDIFINSLRKNKKSQK